MPTTPTGQKILSQFRSDRARRVKDYPVHWLDAADLDAIEAEAAAMERERLLAAGWHANGDECITRVESFDDQDADELAAERRFADESIKP